MRIEVFYKNPEEDGRSYRLKRRLEASGVEIVRITIIDVYIVENGPAMEADTAAGLFSDRIAQDILFAGENGNFAAEQCSWDLLAEVAYKPGVTDPLGISARQTIELEFDLPKDSNLTVRTARQYLFSFPDGLQAAKIVGEELYNPLIQDAVIIQKPNWDAGMRVPEHHDVFLSSRTGAVDFLRFDHGSDEDLLELSKSRLLALSLQEMKAIQDYYSSESVQRERRRLGLPPDAATDVELEMLAQTWSEHCKHKIFAADINYRNGETGATAKISSLFKTYIQKVTEEVSRKKNFLRSVFHDNAGVVQFNDSYCLCFKVETHNSPSALDPYGGAITGIVGVNRDILGTGKGAKPIFNTNVLCFGEPDMAKEELPAGLLHPKTIMHGVHQGIIDGGNQSGIPVAAGGFLFDESFTGKPLVFCGTGGILPAQILGESSWIKHIDPGDKAVMLGGRIGKDGIHGATFSSQELNEESPTSAVQIGDPITQKKMTDFLLEARDLGLYKGITDNGAGGLSSSLGEMAEISGGIRVQLDACPLKYQGLAPWEIFVSESQERMSLAVSGETLEPFLELAAKRDVEAAVIGVFTDSGRVDLLYESKLVGCLDLEFLHKGVPVMKLQAEWNPPLRGPGYSESADKKPMPAEFLLTMLSEPNIASKESMVRQYDHEVQAGSVVKPFCGVSASGPSDGGVLKPHFQLPEGITVTHGICPRYGDIDTYHMAMCAVDEAMRAHVALGGDPETACALDNFCWPDPVESEQTPDGRYKCAQLVRACQGLYDACAAYELPLVSGKDSMKNDARIGDVKVSIRPTLLISLMGLVPNMANSMTTDFKRTGDTVFVLGETREELGGTIFEKCSRRLSANVPKVDPVKAFLLYKRLFSAISAGLIESCHDCSDGGLAVAVVECAIGGECGVSIDLDRIPTPAERRYGDDILLYSETPSRFIVSVSGEKENEFTDLFSDCVCRRIGTVADSGEIIFTRGDRTIMKIPTAAAAEAWKA